MKKKVFIILICLLALHFFLLFSTKFTAWPEMLAWPYLITKGWLPYRDIAIAHTPLLIFDLTIFYKIFGVGVWQIKTYGWLLILASDVIVFFVARRLSNLKTAIISLLLYIPLQIFYEGNGLWFDYAIAPMALLSFYLIKEKKYLLSGLIWGLAFFTKQTAFWFLPAIVFLFLGEDFWLKIKQFATGALVVAALAFITFGLIGILPNFLYWAFKFGVGTLPAASGQTVLPTLKSLLVALFPFSILAVVLVKDRQKYLGLSLLAILGILGVFPRWELFHFQPGLPFLVILAAIFLMSLKKSEKVIRTIVLLYFIGVLILAARSLARNWHQPDRFLEPSVIKTAQTIKNETAPTDKIFVLNSWDSFYALADRLPATKPLIPQLEWYLTLPKTEKGLIADITSAPPKLVVMQPYTQTGLSAYKPKMLTDYLLKYYQPAEIIDNSFYILKPYK